MGSAGETRPESSVHVGLHFCNVRLHKSDAGNPFWFTDSTTTVKKYSSLMFTLLDEQDNLLKSFSQRVPGLSVRLQSPAFVYLHNTLQRNSTQRPSSSLRSLYNVPLAAITSRRRTRRTSLWHNFCHFFLFFRTSLQPRQMGMQLDS